MNKKLLLSLSSAIVLLASGCLKEKAKPEEIPQAPIPAPATDHRAVLIQSLDNQAKTLVNGLNKVIIEGKFLHNMALTNPPQAIPMTDDNEINKAISYLLSNQQEQGNAYTYKPDSRLCSEVIAKNNPAICIEVMKQVELLQTPSSKTDGSLKISIGASSPFNIGYGQSEIKVQTALSEIIKAIKEVDQVFKQNGEAGFQGTFPTTYAGAFELSASSLLTVSQLSLKITSAVDLRGQNENAEAYSIQIAASPNLASVSLDALSGIGAVAVLLPPALAAFTVHDDQNIAHEVQVSFPGLSGALILNNSLEKVILQALKLSSPDVYVTVDGQAAAQFSLASQIDAQLQSYANGDKSLSFDKEILAQIDIVANPLINATGQLSTTVAQGTELFFKLNSTQAEVRSGSIQLLGTGSFNAIMDAQQGACIEGQQNAPLPLQTAVCQ